MKRRRSTCNKKRRGVKATQHLPPAPASPRSDQIYSLVFGLYHILVLQRVYCHQPRRAFTVPHAPLMHCASVSIAYLVTWLLLIFLPTILSMRLVLQRVKSASVTVEGNVVSSIGPGTLALVGLHEHDSEEDLKYCCKRLLGARLWPNDNGGQWRHGVKQKEYDILCVSQFTLYGTLGSKKQQPDYKLAMKSEQAEQMYGRFLEMLKAQYQPDKIHDGVFGAMMDVALVNDGPVTIMIESEPSSPEEKEEEADTVES